MMNPLDPTSVRHECTRFLTYHYPASPQQILSDLGASTDPRVEGDHYGSGPLIAEFEAQLAELLGKEAALFLPSGTMAQLIALRVWADRSGKRTIGFHPTCHLELHEQDAYHRLHDLNSKLIGNRHQLISRSDLDAVKEPLGALLLELPQREIGGQLPSWEELVEQCEWARERGVILHLDGARLWECQPYYKRDYKEIAGLFDSVYVSFYKILGGIAGAALAGSADLIAEARIWQRRQGGNLVRLFPYVLSARRGMENHLGKIPAYVAHAQAVAKALAELPGVVLLPGLPQTNMFHLFLRGNRSALEQAALTVATETKVWIFRSLQPCQIPGHWGTEWVVGDAGLDVNPAETANLFRRIFALAEGTAAHALG